MTTHYDALVRDVRDAREIADAYFAKGDWSDAALKAGQRSYVLSTVLRHSTNAITPEEVIELRDSWRDVMKGAVSECVYVDVTRCQFKRRPSVMLVRWRVRQNDEPDNIPEGEATGVWSVAIMSVPDFHAFLGEFYLKDSDI